MSERPQHHPTIDLGIEHLSEARVIGRGGFSTVYAATDVRFDRTVAVKVLRPLDTAADRAQFDRECRVMGRLSSHPGVITVHHGGFTSTGDPYIVMELSDQGSLADRLERTGPVEWREAVSLMIPIVDALEHAHRAGVLHRDIKPENILVGEGRPLLADFGIASIREATRSMSVGVTASLLHAAPETFSNRRDERSDIYSAASTLYQLIAGWAPFQRSGEESMHPLMFRLLNEAPPVLPAGRAPDDLDRLLARCLAKDPDQRPADAATFARDLRTIVERHQAGPQAQDFGATRLVSAPMSGPGPTPEPTVGPAPMVPPGSEPGVGRGDARSDRSRSGLVATAAGVLILGVIGVSLLALVGGGTPGSAADEVVSAGSPAGAAVEPSEDRADDRATTGGALGDSDPSEDTGGDDESDGGSGPAAVPTTTAPRPVGPSVIAPTFNSPAGSLEEMQGRWAQSRAAVVEALSSDAYGVGEDNVLRGPGGLAVDLDRCPADWSDTAGVDDTTIRIGMTAPGLGLLGDASDIGAGLDDYFRYLNDHGGIDGRRIELVAREDGNDLARTQAAADDFLGPDAVLAATTIGTAQSLVLAQRFGAECLPHPFVLSAHPALADPVGHPFTITGLMPWSAEAALWGEWISVNLADQLPVTVAALVADSEFGYQGYAEPFAAWIEANPGVVADFSIVPHSLGALSLTEEMAEVAAAEPDVFISMTAGADCRTAVLAMAEVDLGASVRFNPSVCRDADNLLAPAGAVADGILVLSSGIEPTTDPDRASDPYVAHVRDHLAASGLVDNGLYGSGFGYHGWLWGEALQIASELPGGLTRSNLVLTMWSLELVHPLVDDGVRLSAAGPEDPILLEGSAVLRYDATTRSLISQSFVEADGLTPSCARYLSRCG